MGKTSTFEKGDVDDLVRLLHRRVAEVDEDVRPAHHVGVQVTGAVAGLARDHHLDVLGQRFSQVVGDRRAAPLESFRELEAHGLGVALFDGVDDAVEFVVPLPVVLQRETRIPEVSVGAILAHYPGVTAGRV